MNGHYQRIYEQIAHLFYAVAMADKQVKPAEIKRLNEVVEKVWLAVEGSKDEFGTDAAHYISIAFDFLNDNYTSSQDAFDTFAHYYKVHQAVFSPDLKKRIRHSAGEIAEAFKGVNKAELKVLNRLDQLFAMTERGD